MLGKVYCLAALVAIFSGAAQAEEDPMKCALELNNLTRLTCYDLIFKSKLKETNFSAWRARIESSRLDDGKNVLLSTYSKEMISCGWNRKGRVTLVLRCVDGRSTIFLNTPCYMASSDDNGKVTYRIDQDEAQVVSMDTSKDRSSLSLLDVDRSELMMKKMFGKKRMIVRMTPHGQSSFTTTFDITGTEEAAKPLRRACGW